jgi:hypothetical protein
MKPSAAQCRVLVRMAGGAVLRWSSTHGRFELRDGAATQTVQARTVEALGAMSLIALDVAGDCMLTSAGSLRVASPTWPP